MFVWKWSKILIMKLEPKGALRTRWSKNANINDQRIIASPAKLGLSHQSRSIPKKKKNITHSCCISFVAAPPMVRNGSRFHLPISSFLFHWRLFVPEIAVAVNYFRCQHTFDNEVENIYPFIGDFSPRSSFVRILPTFRCIGCTIVANISHSICAAYSCSIVCNLQLYSSSENR